jgi:apolipoprotein N-acyltransferase
VLKIHIVSEEKVNSTVICSAIASGLLLTASFPDFGYSWIAWFALFPLLYTSRNLCPRHALFTGFIAGFSHYITLIYWLISTMNDYGHVPVPICIILLFLLSGYLSLYIALFTFALSRFGPVNASYLVLVPVLWVAVEYLRTFLFTGFPWELLGHSQYAILPVIQLSDITGVYGISFLVALVNAAILLTGLFLSGKDKHDRVLISKSTAFTSMGITILCLCLVIFYGYFRINKMDHLGSLAEKKKIAVVQGNVDQSLKWEKSFQLETIDKYLRLSFASGKDKPELIVWPETATPFYFLHTYEEKLSSVVQKGIKKAGVWFIIGSPANVVENETDLYLNSAYLMDPEGREKGRYDKVHLVPYGEYIPLRKWFPFVDKLVHGIGDFSSGKKGSTISWKDVKLGVQICFEVIFPDLARASVKNGADILINITNDAWFGRTSAPYQHLSMTIFRAVENRKALVRCANTGISCFVGPSGRIFSPTSLYSDEVVTREVPVMKTEPTVYTRFGDFFAILCTVAAFLLTALHYFKNSTQ